MCTSLDPLGGRVHMTCDASVGVAVCVWVIIVADDPQPKNKTQNPRVARLTAETDDLVITPTPLPLCSKISGQERRNAGQKSQKGRKTGPGT